jgi:hypothetical protein
VLGWINWLAGLISRAGNACRSIRRHCASGSGPAPSTGPAARSAAGPGSDSAALADMPRHPFGTLGAGSERSSRFVVAVSTPAPAPVGAAGGAGEEAGSAWLLRRPSTASRPNYGRDAAAHEAPARDVSLATRRNGSCAANPLNMTMRRFFGHPACSHAVWQHSALRMPMPTTTVGVPDRGGVPL